MTVIHAMLAEQLDRSASLLLGGMQVSGAARAPSTADARADGTGRLTPRQADTSASAGNHVSGGLAPTLLLVSPLLRLLDFMLRAGLLVELSTIEALGPALMRVLRACSLYAIEPPSAAHATPAMSDSSCGSSSVFVDSTSAPGAGPELAGRQRALRDRRASLRAALLRTVRLACSCVEAVLLLQRHLEMSSVLIAVRDGALTRLPAEETSPPGLASEVRVDPPPPRPSRLHPHSLRHTSNLLSGRVRPTHRGRARSSSDRGAARALAHKGRRSERPVPPCAHAPTAAAQTALG